MPKEVEEKLKRTGAARGYTGERLQRYVYGTMNRRGLLKRSKKKRSGQKGAFAAMLKEG